MASQCLITDTVIFDVQNRTRELAFQASSSAGSRMHTDSVTNHWRRDTFTCPIHRESVPEPPCRVAYSCKGDTGTPLQSGFRPRPGPNRSDRNLGGRQIGLKKAQSTSLLTVSWVRFPTESLSIGPESELGDYTLKSNPRRDHHHSLRYSSYLLAYSRAFASQMTVLVSLCSRDCPEFSISSHFQTADYPISVIHI